MKKDEIHLGDINRILFGQAPPEFLLEVLIRSIIIYVAAIVVMRWLGKRMNGQLTILELSIMVMMGAILAVPMQIPDRGLSQGFLVLLCTLLFLRGVNWLAFKSARFEKLVQGEVSTLVKDGVINLAELDRTRITRQQLFETLREKKIFNLGQVKRYYLEACGLFSLYPQNGERPGLPLFPQTDKEVLSLHRKADDTIACTNCGWIEQQKKTKACPHCGEEKWTNAIV
ncbi:MAG: DUF421 domain-containing protein [Flavisolibacter sp.]